MVLESERVETHVARIDVNDGDAPPLMTEAQLFQIDAFSLDAKPGETPRRNTAGEYVPVALLRDSSIAIVTTIQNRAPPFGLNSHSKSQLPSPKE